MKVNLSYDSLLALYLALRAAQRGHPKVVISNKALQKWLRKKKLREYRIRELAEKLKPIFYDHLIKKDPNTNGYMLTLYLTQKEGMSAKTKGIPVVDNFLSEEFMSKALGIEVI